MPEDNGNTYSSFLPDQKPKILALIQLPPPVHGAAMMNQIVINSELVDSFFSIDCIPLNFASSNADVEKFRIKKLFKVVLIASKLVKSLVASNHKFVYFTLSPIGHAFYRDLLFIAILKLFRKKILYHLHGKGIKTNSDNSKTKTLLYKFAFHNTSVIVLAPSLAKDIETVFSGTPFVVNNGIPEKISMPPQSSDHAQTTNILYLSNLIITKGILLLLDSIDILKKRNIPFHLNIVGNDGSVSVHQLTKMITDLHLNDSISILGPKYDVEKYMILTNSDIFCLPTFKDAFPLVLLEAMQCGLPVVSTLEGAIPDIVKHDKTGLLVAKQNSEVLANALQHLIENPKTRIEMGKKGRERFNCNFTLNHFEKNIADTFKAMIA